jgi:hypothetical protein
MKIPYDPIKNFAPVASIGVAPQVRAPHPGVTANTVQSYRKVVKATNIKID